MLSIIHMRTKNNFKANRLSLLLVSTGFLLSANTYAAIHKDAFGNTGYDTAAECDAAVQNGSAKFYQPVTKSKPLKQKGEKTVKTMLISDLGDEYRLGACDKGAGPLKGRRGVDRKLQGKYVAFSPAMPLNTYMDASGKIVRVSMKVCDNRFSAAMPRPVSMPAPPPPVVVVPSAPAVVVIPPAPPPVVAAPPAPELAPVAPAPMVTPAAPVAETGMKPYVFGLVGAQKDAICHVDGQNANLVVGQVGAGININELIGAEVYAQASNSHTYSESKMPGTSKTSAVGARMTIGTNVAPQFRVFGKVGAAYVNHQYAGDSNNEVRPTLGIGFTYDFTPVLSLRGDADMSFKRNKNQPHPAWGDDKFVGLGLQYKF